MLLNRIFITLILTVGLLSGCSDPGMSDLEEYARRINARKNPNIPQIPAFRIIPSYFYEVEKMRDPFASLEKVGPEIKERNVDLTSGTAAAETPCNRPNQHRVLSDLERLPLDTLKMIGTLQTDNQLWALVVEKSTGTVHRIQQGDYMGQNYGQVINVTEDRIELQEQYPDSKGCYSEQATDLPLNDKK